jgi:restriction endonuclease Mrr
LLPRPLPELLAQLRTADARSSRQALEALVVRFLGFLSLEHVGTRHVTISGKPGTASDMLFESESLFLRRWQVRCRNATLLTVDDVAAAVGVLGYCQSDVGVVVCTGEVEPAAAEFAGMVRRSMRQPIVILDGENLVSLVENPGALVSTVRKSAPEALTLAG